MKRVYFLWMLCLSTLFMAAQDPIVITEDDVASIGDEFMITNANPVISFDPYDTGENHVWDFSFLEPMNTDTSKWLNEEDTDPIYFFLWFSSDIAEQTFSDIVTGYFTVEDVFNFYKKNSGEFALSGFAGTISDIPFPIGFEDDDVIYEFPLEYGNTFSSAGYFNIDIPGIASWSEVRDRTTSVDGWGTITTPFSTFDVLRTKSVVVITDTIVYDAIEIPFTYTTTEYKWLAQNGGIPVLQINAQTILGTETITQVMYRDTMIASSIDSETGNGLNTCLLNNVVDDELILQLSQTNNNPLVASIVDLNGNYCQSFDHLQSGINTLSVSSELSRGFYLLVIKSNEQIIFSAKFIKSK